MFVVERVSHDDGLSRFEDVVDDGVGKQVVVDRLLIEIARDVADDFSVAYDEQKAFVTSVMRGEVKECNGKAVSIAVRLKALELLGKMQGIYINKVETDVNVKPVVIHDDL